jgi:hypothetical protein
MAKIRKKKHKLNCVLLPSEYGFSIVGVQTEVPIHRVSFHLNKCFFTDFSLHINPYQIQRKKIDLSFEYFLTSIDNNNNYTRLINNKSLVEIDNPGSLFNTKEAFYLFPEIEGVNYLLFIPDDSKINIQKLQQNFTAPYSVKWIDINMDKLISEFPVFTEEN